VGIAGNIRVDDSDFSPVVYVYYRQEPSSMIII
jgi:hypothetical protein